MSFVLIEIDFFSPGPQGLDFEIELLNELELLAPIIVFSSKISFSLLLICASVINLSVLFVTSASNL